MKQSSLIVTLSVAIAAAVVLSLIAAGIYWQSSNSSIVPTTNKVASPLESFSSPIAITSAAAEGPAFTPGVGIDKNSGTTYVAFFENSGEKSNVYIKKSDNGGKTFSDPVRVNNVEGDAFFDGRVSPVVKVGPDGEVYVMWGNGEPAPKLFMKALRGLSIASSVDGAATFSPAVKIAANEPPADKSFYSLEVSPDGNVYAAWLQFPAVRYDNGTIVSDSSGINTARFARSLDGGRTFEPSVEVDQDPCECCNVNLLAGSDGSVYMTWRKKFEVPSTVGMSTTIRDMVIVRSDDGGKTFTQPTKINNDNFEFDGCVHVGAPMAMDSKGRIHIVWYTGKEGGHGIYYSVSSDKGDIFGNPVPILIGDWVPPLRSQLVIDGNDNAWIAWEDSSGLSANTKNWKYEDTRAMIYAAMVTPDGQVIKKQQPINELDGRSPVMASGADLISIVWADSKNQIQCSTLSPST